MTFRYLSYPIMQINPAYGKGAKAVKIEPLKSISKGDPCCTYSFTMENHLGTHVDCPAHFFRQAKSVFDYDAGFWFFHKPQVISLKAGRGQIFRREDLKTKIKKDSDILIFHSGWSKFRGKKIYSQKNPGLDPEIGLWLRKEYPRIRAIGLDWISLSSYLNRDLGRKAHRAFLNPARVNHPILIIEDMNINSRMKGLKSVLAVPLRINGLDSAPCTVLGEFND